MKFPGAPYGLKMACGENPKRVYGAKGRMPTTRMGNVALDRQAWADAQNYLRKWQDYERKAKDGKAKPRSEEHTSELQSLMRISYAVFCLKKKKTQTYHKHTNTDKCIHN